MIDSIDWGEWCGETFRKAQDEDKPILLSLDAVWCYLCRVMEMTTYSDPTVVELVNNDFVPLRVDNDKRPDISERYNQGGLPSAVFLTPSGDILTGSTYMPPEQMRELLVRVRNYYRQNRVDIYARILQQRQQRLAEDVRRRRSRRDDEDLSTEIVEKVVDFVVTNFDAEYGGFGTGYKFPHPEVIDFVLWDYHKIGDEELLEVAIKTLDAIREGELCDKESGGFFRYSSRKDWSAPHCEKMLAVNAGLLITYLQAYQALGDESYRKTAENIIAYINSTLLDKENGGFYGSQADDEEYYKLSQEERKYERPPYIDRTIYTDWNAMMASAYIHAWIALDKPAMKKMGLKTLDRLLRHSYQQGGGICHYHDGEPHISGLLKDQVDMIQALAKTYQYTGEVKYLDAASDIADFVLEKLVDFRGGSFFDIPDNSNALGRLKERDKRISTNAAACNVFIDMYYLTGKSEYMEVVGVALAYFLKDYERYNHLATEYALAVDRYLNYPVKIGVIGTREDEQTMALTKAALEFYEPRKLMQIFDPSKDGELLAKTEYVAMDKPVIYICIGSVCSEPYESPEQFATGAEEFIKRNTYRTSRIIG